MPTSSHRFCAVDEVWLSYSASDKFSRPYLYREDIIKRNRSDTSTAISTPQLSLEGWEQCIN